jgi:Fe-S-cluster containining protein
MVDCRDCGACCSILLFPVDASRETKIFYRSRGLDVYSNAVNCTFVVVPHRCKHLEANSCNIYETRPLSCKAFKKEGELCKLCVKVRLIESQNKG